MNIRRPLISIIPYTLIFLIGLFSCRQPETHRCLYNVLVVVAHPDDETLVSGTLAKLIDKGCDVTIVYTTSGDDGPDMTKQGLHGDALAEVRETEAQKSLNHIDVTNPPLFLKFPDSHVWEYTREIKDTLIKIFQQIEPHVVITFGPDGVTDDLDHITTGYITGQVFDSTKTCKLLLHMAISRKASSIYPIPVPIDDSLINLRVDVSDYKRTRYKSNSAHRTQFGFGQRLFWKMFVRRFPFEEFVIAGNREGEQLLKECF